MRPRTRATFLIGALVVLLTATGAHAARNFALKGKNELSGGFGFQAGLTDWTPGGFKWFNEYNRELGRIVWLNVQFNLVLGGEHHWGAKQCCDARHCWDCGWYDDHHFSGWAVETALGVKFKWRMQKIPLQFHCKVGGTLAPIFEWGAEGVELGLRGGFGVRYFVVPSLGVGGEFMNDFGPIFLNHDVGWHFYATFDFNVGVEWRF